MAGVVTDRVIVELEAKLASYHRDVLGAQHQFDRSATSIITAAQNMERRVEQSATNMSRHLRQAISAVAVGYAIRETTQYADAWLRVENRLAAAGIAHERLGQRQNDVVNLAVRTRTALEDTAQSYQRATLASAAMGATEVQVARFVEITNKALAASGASGTERAAAVIQLSQALASGVLQGDELRSIRENSPAIALAIAKEFNTTIGGLKKLGEEGKLTSDRVFKGILSAGKEVDAQFARTTATVEDSFTILETKATQFIGQVNEATGATRGLSEFITYAADNLEVFAAASVVAATALGGALAGRAISQVVGALERQRTAQVATQAAQQASTSAAVQAAIQEAAAQDQAVAGIQEKMGQLQLERAAYAQNIAMIQAQRAELVQLQATAAANARAGFGSIAIGGGVLAGAGADKETATKALIQNRRALAAADAQLAAAEANLAAAQAAQAAASTRASGATQAHIRAIRSAGLAATLTTGAMRGLTAALAFFGGPIGLAITAVALAVGMFMGESIKAEIAVQGLTNTIDTMASRAERAGVAVTSTADASDKSATASAGAAKQADAQAGAYERVRVAAINAGRAIAYMTAQERASALEDVRKGIRALESRVSGGILDPVQTDLQEKESNASKRFAESVAGARVQRGMEGGYVQEGLAAKNLSAEQQRLRQEYLNAKAVRQDNERQLSAARQLEKDLFNNINAPTLAEPEVSTANLKSPPAAADKKKGRKGKGTDEALQRTRQFEDDLARYQEEMASAVGEAADAAGERRDIALERTALDAKARDEAEAAHQVEAKARRDAALAAIEADHKGRQRDLDRALDDGDLNPVRHATLTAAREALEAQERIAAENRYQADLARDQNAVEERKRQLEEDGIEAAKAIRDFQTELLSIRSSLARTAKDRGALELEILRLAQEERRQALERQAADLTLTEAKREAARRALADLDALEAGETERTRRANRTPLEAYREDLPRTPQEQRESVEGRAVQAIDSFIDALANADGSVESFAQALLGFVEDIGRIFLRTLYERLFADPLARVVNSLLDKIFPGTASATAAAAATANAQLALSATGAAGSLAAAALAADAAALALTAVAAQSTAEAGADFLTAAFSALSGGGGSNPAGVFEIRGGGHVSHGRVQRYDRGGLARGRGGPTTDSIDAKISDGEYVVRASAVKAVGVGTLHAINRMGFANGGLAGINPHVRGGAAGFGGTNLTVTYAPVYGPVTGSGPEVEALRQEIAYDRATFEGRVKGAVSEGLATRTITA